MKRQFVFLTNFVLILALSPAAFAQKFHNDDPLLQDNDKAVNVTSITKHKLNDQYDFFLHSFGKPGDRSKGPAVNANTIGEVPNSGWFQNRQGMAPMSLSELINGPDAGNVPSTEQPWVIIKAKT